MVAFPYPKRMCANIDVDQAAALLLCSYETARAAGVPDDRLVFPLSGADAHDHCFCTERARLDASPAHRRRRARPRSAAAGITVDDVAASTSTRASRPRWRSALHELGLGGPAAGDDRPLTVTGGLGFAGGPANNYPTHAIAAMVEACRPDPGSVGFVKRARVVRDQALGRLLLDDAAGRRLRAVDPAETQRRVDALPRRAWSPAPTPARQRSRPPPSSSSATAPRRSGSCRPSRPTVGGPWPTRRDVEVAARHDHHRVGGRRRRPRRRGRDEPARREGQLGGRRSIRSVSTPSS